MKLSTSGRNRREINFMHHEKNNPQRFRRDALIAAVVLGLGFILLPGCRRQSSAENRGRSGPVSPVSAATAKRGNLDVYLDAIGTVTPVYTVTVTSRVAGELTEVDYREGQILKKGDLLAVIDPRPYQAALLQATGQLARDQALLKNARIELTRYQEAYHTHAIPELQVDTAEAAVEENEGIVRLDQGAVDAARVNLDYTRIVSPINGRVGLRLMDPGNIVQANGTVALATVTQLQPMTVIFTIAEDHLSDVVEQMRSGRPLPVLALDRSQSKQLAAGTLLTIDNQIDTTTGTVKARATFANLKNELFPNQFVNARLLLKTLDQVVVIPTAAVQLNEAQSFVYKVQPGGIVQFSEVGVTATDGESAAGTGVEPGDTLVTAGFDRLQNGLKVSIRPVAAGAARPSGIP
jgi:membrane fusion protein, multidrug efflux system